MTSLIKSPYQLLLEHLGLGPMQQQAITPQQMQAEMIARGQTPQAMQQPQQPLYMAAGGQPKIGEARAYDPSWTERARDFVANNLRGGYDLADRLFGGPRAQPADILLQSVNPASYATSIADLGTEAYHSAKAGDAPAALGYGLATGLSTLPMLKKGMPIAERALQTFTPGNVGAIGASTAAGMAPGFVNALSKERTQITPELMKQWEAYKKAEELRRLREQSPVFIR